MNQNLKYRLTIIGSLAIILASCFWIYITQTQTTRHNIGLHQRIGEVLAEQTATVLGDKGRIVTISIDPKEWPELRTQINAFKAKLKRLGDYHLHEYQLDTKDQPKYGVGTGLSGRRYVRTVKKNPEADLFISFVGAPKLDEAEIAELGKKPKLIVESRSGDNLPGLFEYKLVLVAVVSRFQFPAPGPEKPRTADQWFQKRYQILTSTPTGRLATAE